MTKQFETCPIDPARLASGQWCHRANKTIGQGDINASYSADRIGMSQPIRKAFSWRGALWVCVSNRYHGEHIEAEAYRITHPAAFDGEPVSYGEVTSNGEAARNSPQGFYHGMAVKHGGGDAVLCGPPVKFIPGQPEQGSLF